VRREHPLAAALILPLALLACNGTGTPPTLIETGGNCVGGVAGDSGSVSYAEDVVPVFERAGCLTSTCHGGTFVSSGYDLKTYETTFGPGDEAQMLEICNVVPGDPAASYLIEKLGEAPRLGDRMPQNLPPLAQADIDLITTWVLEGAQNN